MFNYNDLLDHRRAVESAHKCDKDVFSMSKYDVIVANRRASKRGCGRASESMPGPRREGCGTSDGRSSSGLPGGLSRGAHKIVRMGAYEYKNVVNRPMCPRERPAQGGQGGACSGGAVRHDPQGADKVRRSRRGLARDSGGSVGDRRAGRRGRPERRAGVCSRPLPSGSCTAYYGGAAPSLGPTTSQ